MKLIFCVLAGLLFGCATERPDPAALRAWAARQGSELDGPYLVRARTIAASLSTPDALHVHVLENRSLSAYSWASGDIYLTTGLLDAATDDELAAALAHEAGHIDQATSDARVASIHGSSLAIEESCDRQGIALLHASNRSADVLVALLRKIIASSPSGQQNQAMRERIRAIEAAADSD